MRKKGFFKITKFKIVIFAIILVLGVVTIKGPSCDGLKCNFSFFEKAISYSATIILPGTSNLMRDNGFFVGHKTSGLVDAIPQLIIHVGIDILYWYLILCIIYSIRNKRESK